MITVNAIGDTCPIPVVKTKKAIEALTQPDTVETLVDNEIAVENLKKMAAQKGYSCDSNKLDDGSYSVKLTIETLNTGAFSDTDEASQYTCRPATDNRVVVIRSSYMGEGSEELGSVLIKGFIYALWRQTGGLMSLRKEPIGVMEPGSAWQSARITERTGIM